MNPYQYADLCLTVYRQAKMKTENVFEECKLKVIKVKSSDGFGEFYEWRATLIGNVNYKRFNGYGESKQDAIDELVEKVNEHHIEIIAYDIGRN